jgi:hypothetical protein
MAPWLETNPPDPQAGHAEGLGKAADDHGVVEVGGAGEHAGVVVVIQQDVVVDLVADDLDAAVGGFQDDGLHASSSGGMPPATPPASAANMKTVGAGALP